MRGLLAIGLLVSVFCTLTLAQIPERDIGGGPGRSSLPRPGKAPPNVEAQRLMASAKKLRLKAGDLQRNADDLRDQNLDEAGAKEDDRAETLLERAKSLERRARQAQLAHGGDPDRILIPALD